LPFDCFGTLMAFPAKQFSVTVLRAEPIKLPSFVAAEVVMRAAVVKK
jgi:hypothetical protein